MLRLLLKQVLPLARTMRLPVVLAALPVVAALRLSSVIHPGRHSRLRVERKLVSSATAVTSEETLVRAHGLEMALFRTALGKGAGKGADSGLSRAAQCKTLFKTYGPAYLTTSISLALVSYALSYLLVANGLDVVALLRKVGLQAVMSPNAGTATIAYAVHKAASPIRFPPTVALTPLVSRALFQREPRAPPS